MKRLSVVVSVFLFLAAVCSAGIVAVAPVGGVVVSDPRPYMLGWQFSVSSALNVDGLGYYDVGGDGLGESHAVGIFDSGTGAVLVSATVPSGTAATLTDGFRVVPVSYLLGPGTYVIGGQQSSNADASMMMAPGLSSIAGVTYLEERELQTSSFEMPTFHGGSEKGIFGPTFTVGDTAIPEPGTFLAMAGGLAILFVLNRRKAGRQQ